METKTTQSRPHSLALEGRQKASLTGVESVISSTDETVSLLTSEGRLFVAGKGIKIERFNVDDGTLVLSGTVDSVRYAAAKAPLMKRLFK